MQNQITRGTTAQVSFIQNTHGNSVKINKNRIIKDMNKDKEKDEIFSTDSNKLISTNDLSGNCYNTYSLYDDNEFKKSCGFK